MKTNKLITMAGLISVVFIVPPLMASDTYDLVILNGRVMDPETKLDEVHNVGIKDGKIAVISREKLKGKETVEAKCLVAISVTQSLPPRIGMAAIAMVLCFITIFAVPAT